jgi:hypothetical protein
MGAIVLDAHAHCGLTVRFEEVSREWEFGDIHGGVLFSPVEEIYDRYDRLFTDSSEYRTSRTRVHEYLLELAAQPNIYPYFFVWNDFPMIPKGFVGIKWHRHSGEPVYNYETPECREIIEEICRRHLPTVLEEEFRNTLDFIKKIASRAVVIIPHMGMLNGGYSRLRKAGIFDLENVWVDTALAQEAVIEDFAEKYGIDRILFGSDYPFGTPSHERQKLVKIFSEEELGPILAGNLLRLLGR